MGRDTYSEEPAFDHLLHWVRDVDSAVAAYSAAGMPAHGHPAVDGFQQGGWRLDERYVEILAVTDTTAFQTSRFATGLDLLRPAIDALGGVHGAITFAVNVTDVRQTASRLRDQGHEVQEFEVEFEESGVSFVEVFPTNAARPWTPFFITYTPPRAEIVRRIDPSVFDRGPHDLHGLEVTTTDPDQAREELSALLGIDAVDGAIPLPGAHISFVAGDREAITAVTLSGTDPENESPPAEIDGLIFHRP